MASPSTARSLAALFAAALVLSVNQGAMARGARSKVADVVAGTVRPVMARYHVPGMAIGIAAGNHSYVFDYGVAAIASRKPVTRSSPQSASASSSWPTGTIR